MIVEAFLDGLEIALQAVIDLIPDWTPPGWVTDGSFASALNDVATKAQPMGSWLNFGLWASVLVVVMWAKLAGIAASLAMKVYAMVRGGAS